jgi:hypothetical protein
MILNRRFSGEHYVNDANKIKAISKQRQRIPQKINVTDILCQGTDPIRGNPTYGHIMFISEQGFLGIAPPRAQAGDIVAVLFGGEKPYLLRPVLDHDILVGECFGKILSKHLSEFH